MSSREAPDSEQYSRRILQQAETVNAKALLAMMLGVWLIAFATWLGTAWRGQADMPAGIPQALDAQRKVLFKATVDGGVQVLSLRNGVSELAVLREPSRQVVYDIALDAEGRTLWVLGEHSAYRYDAHSLKPLSRMSVLAANGSGARFDRVSRDGASVNTRDLN